MSMFQSENPYASVIVTKITESTDESTLIMVSRKQRTLRNTKAARDTPQVVIFNHLLAARILKA